VLASRTVLARRAYQPGAPYVEHRMSIRTLFIATLLTPLLIAATTPRIAAQSTLLAMPVADAPIIDYQNRYLPAYGKAGMVVSPEKLAASTC
jgi:hypothetical protein